ncbi:hypothetical protein PXI32_003707, partial [Enterobacter hormaechei]
KTCSIYIVHACNREEKAMKKPIVVTSKGYAKLLTPKGNSNDGFAVSNDFEKVFFKYSSQGLSNQVEEMMNDWISEKVRSEEEAIFKDIKHHSRIKTA